jgi:glycosyltransferase involved in cell wall biosynthesis
MSGKLSKAGQDSPFVSVIIPAHNEQEFVEQTINSVLNNAYPYFEVIVVDDGSTDNTHELVSRLCFSNNVRLVRTPARVGAGASRNLGMQVSEADYFFFTDADCLVDRCWIAEGMEVLRKHDVDAVEGSIFYCLEKPTLRHNVPLNPIYNLALAGALSCAGRDYAGGNFAVKAIIIDRLGGFDEKRYRLGREDTDLGMRICQIGKIEYLPKMKVHHREALWTLSSLLDNAKRYESDVYMYIDHDCFTFSFGRILHPMFLLMMIFPPYILVRLKPKSWKDMLFLPKLYAYLVKLRFVIWRTAIAEKEFVL